MDRAIAGWSGRGQGAMAGGHHTGHGSDLTTIIQHGRPVPKAEARSLSRKPLQATHGGKTSSESRLIDSPKTPEDRLPVHRSCVARTAAGQGGPLSACPFKNLLRVNRLFFPLASTASDLHGDEPEAIYSTLLVLEVLKPTFLCTLLAHQIIFATSQLDFPAAV